MFEDHIIAGLLENSQNSKWTSKYNQGVFENVTRFRSPFNSFQTLFWKIIGLFQPLMSTYTLHSRKCGEPNTYHSWRWETKKFHLRTDACVRIEIRRKLPVIPWGLMKVDWLSRQVGESNLGTVFDKLEQEPIYIRKISSSLPRLTY